MAKAYWKTVAIGDLIPPLIKTSVNRVHFCKLAAATKDFNPLHIDDEYARTHGYGGVFAPGNLTLAVVEEALYNFAENGRLIRMLGTFHKLVWPGDMLTAKALISDKYKHNSEPRIELEIWIENQYHDVVIKGQATYILFESSKDETDKPTLPKLSDTSKHDMIQTIRAKLASLSYKEDESSSDDEQNTSAKSKKPVKKPAPKKKTSN